MNLESSPNTETMPSIKDFPAFWEVVSSTEGFQCFTDDQKKLLKELLYTGHRAERDPHYHEPQQSIDDRGPDVVAWEPNKHSHYQKSNTHIATWICHTLAYSLENPETSIVSPPDVPEGIFSTFFPRKFAEYTNTSLNRELIQDEKPQVLFFGEGSGILRTEYYHSALSLGRRVGKNGKAYGTCVILEKPGVHENYKLSPLSKYPIHFNKIGIRTLRGLRQSV